MYDDKIEYYDYLLQNNFLFVTENGNTIINEDIFNSDINWEEISKYFIKNNFVIVDEVLKEEYIERMRRFILFLNYRENIYSNYATINFKEKSENLWFPMLKIISMKLKEKISVIRDLNFLKAWAVIYDNVGEGTLPHIDPGSIITVNLWVTPNECVNHNTNFNGLVLTDINPRPDENKDIYKNISKDDSIVKKVIPYNYNRMTIFRGSHLHFSQPTSTKFGYSNKKINYSFLYGH
jgi:hypothetical protein